MNTRWKLILAAVGLLVIIVALWLVRRSETPGASKPQDTAEIRATPNPAPPQEPQQAAVTPAATPPPNLDRAAKIDRAVQTANVPIKFWGKVVEPGGESISGVNIEFGVKQVYSPWFGAASETEKKRTVQTGGDGMFSISGDSGLTLNIRSVTKPGYRLSTKAQTSFAYTASPYLHAPRQDAPVTFVMLREDAKEALVRKMGKLYVPCDGTAATYNLLTGKEDSAGQLKITFRREPVHVQPGQRFSWSATLEVPGGGIMEIPESAAYIAPEDGWLESLVFEKDAQDAQWQSGFARSVYVRTADTKYGRVNVRLTGDFEPPPTACALEVFMNPSGSRILEPGGTAQASPR